MSSVLVTVEQAAQELNLHAKTVLRYIREGRLPAKRIGKAYRISRPDLDVFAGVTRGEVTPSAVHTTCIVEVRDIAIEQAERLASFVQSVALSGSAQTPPLHLQTAFDPAMQTMKLILIGAPLDVAKLLEMIELQLRTRA